MKKWEAFELACTDYLNRQFGEYAEFVHQGGEDATVPDIFVKTKSGDTFYMEVKHTPAQCGQFVLLPDIATSTFVYSSKNVTPINPWANMIMEHVDQSFDVFREAGTAGKEIVFEQCQQVFSNWIIDAYKQKNVQYFITNGFTVLPIDKFFDFFAVSAVYRIKRSGSTGIGKSRATLYGSLLSERCNYNITETRVVRDKLFVSSKENLHNVKFMDGGCEYMFSARGDEYEVRRLSNTYNANVIFSIGGKDTQGLSEAEIINRLK